VFIILSQMTTGPSFNRVYDRIKADHPTWDSLAALPLRALKAAIKDAGLSGQKAPRLRAISARLKDDFGSVTLAPLAEMTAAGAGAEAYLTSLPAVGVKTAKGVLTYSLQRDVLPLDTHVWRLTKRLALVGTDVPYPKAHAAAEAVVAPADRYSLHVNGLAHGRAVCLALRPKCGKCPLRRLCPTGKVASAGPDDG